MRHSADSSKRMHSTAKEFARMNVLTLVLVRVWAPMVPMLVVIVSYLRVRTRRKKALLRKPWVWPVLGLVGVVVGTLAVLIAAQFEEPDRSDAKLYLGFWAAATSLISVVIMAIFEVGEGR
jgi:hypothetical protein